VVGVDRPAARSALTAAAEQRRLTREADEQARSQLDEAIVVAFRSGLTITEISSITGQHRNWVSKLVQGIERD
jgi:hypothetical protein